MQKRHMLLIRLALAATIATLGASVAQAASYYAVLPLAGVDATQSSRPIQIALAGATPPPAYVGVPYSFNLGALLSLDGPDGTDAANVTWSVFSGTLPAGLVLAGNTISGTPTEASAPVTVKVRAEYAQGFQSVGTLQGYVFGVFSSGLTDFGGYRAWADGAFAQSCNEYLLPADGVHQYAGDMGDGTYRIAPAGLAPFNVRCDMVTDGGGWTLVEYAEDLPLANRWVGADAWRWVPANFGLALSDEQIDAVRAVSVNARQRYVGRCLGVLHYYSTRPDQGYAYSIGFRFHTGLTTNYGARVYSPPSVKVVSDGCTGAGGGPSGGGKTAEGSTIFDIENINLPVINVVTRDNGGAPELFGSPLTQYPARFR